jgi:hypothetical protein
MTSTDKVANCLPPFSSGLLDAHHNNENIKSIIAITSMEILSKWKARLKILPITETKSQSYLSITGNCSKINENTPNNASKVKIIVTTII